jgi:vitamin B12 transport system substrate-binding protein
VLLKNPQVIIIPHHSGSKDTKIDVWEQWQSIDAVKNDYLFTLNGDLLHRFGPRAIDGLEKLCEVIDKGRKE